VAETSPLRNPSPEKIPFAKPLVQKPASGGASSPGIEKIPFPAARGMGTGGSTPGLEINVSTQTKSPAARTSSGRNKRRDGNSRKLALLLFGLMGSLTVAALAGVFYFVSHQESPRTIASRGNAKNPTSKPVVARVDVPSVADMSAGKKQLATNRTRNSVARGARGQKAAALDSTSSPDISPTPQLAVNATPSSPPSEKPEGSSPAPIDPATTVPPPTTTPPVLTAEDQENEGILELFTSQKILLKKEYPRLRKIHAARFARQHEAEIRQGLGKDADEGLKWLEEHPDIQEELYLAITPHDKVAAVMSLFNELRVKFPEKIVPYASLAIATAVVWDEPRGLQEYAQDAVWTKAIMPEGQLAALENFQYLVEAEPWMQGRIRYVPWEFLVYVVNHRTPLPERLWVYQNYLNKRVMFGRCYSEVPYDHEMLNTNRERTKMMGSAYTLPNIRRLGGICEIQADFASRVGKSLGVPASHVSGKGAFGGPGHAWVMWVELKQATPTGIVFTLESHGRYSYDHYYVGSLRDPHTGQPITDRDMELRLQTVGSDVVGKRHMDLVMQSYSLIKEKSNLDTEQQLRFLSQIIAVCPGHEEAWMSAARLARESAGDKRLSKQFNAVFEGLFTTFARIPDFTWKVFDDLAAYSAEAKQRNKLYERLVALYESAGRPDLAVEARLRLTDYLLEEKREGEAIQGLAITVKKFPAEGELVPRLLDRLELICANYPNSGPQLVQFYTQFLPLIPQKRGNDPSEYCIEMYQRAIALFQKNNQPQLVQTLQAELTRIQSGQRK
jgi:hypothetical protein